MLRYHVFSDRLGRYTGVPMTGKRGRPRKPSPLKWVGPKPVTKSILRAFYRERTGPSDRNLQICAYYFERHTLEETGQQFGITRERVRQIIQALGYSMGHRRDSGAYGVIQPFKPRPTAFERFWSYVDKSPHPQGCWIWTGGCQEAGYGRIYFRGKYYPASHLAYWFVKKRKIKNHGLHMCHNPECVNPDHIYDGTAKDNARDRDNAGRGGSFKLDLETVRAIHANPASSVAERRAEAAKFGISVTTFKRIQSGKHHLLTGRPYTARVIQILQYASKHRCCASHLIDKCKIPNRSIWRIVKQMESDGLITAQDATRRGHPRIIELTDKGWQKLNTESKAA